MKREVLKHLFPKKVCMNLEILLPNFSLIHMPTLNLYIKNIPALKSNRYDPSLRLQNHLDCGKAVAAPPCTLIHVVQVDVWSRTPSTPGSSPAAGQKNVTKPHAHEKTMDAEDL
jgi:hypothetical protein